MTFLNVAKDASSLAFASLIQQCYWGKSLLLDGRKVNRNRKIFIVAGASSPLFGVSWLKIEPRVSIFPCNKGSLSNRVDETILVKELSSVRLLNSFFSCWSKKFRH